MVSQTQANKVAATGDLEGELQNVVFSNESGSFVVARLKTENGKLATIVGNLAGVQPGEVLKMRGEWIKNPKYGDQFSVQSYVTQSPKTKVGLVRYLSSGILPGVGPKTAEKIVEQFGVQTLEVLNQDPAALKKIAKLGSKKIDGIVASWQGRKQLHEVMVFLQGHGITPSLAMRIYKIYKDQAVSVLKSNPYRLAWEVYGIGFKRADQIAKELGVAADSVDRCEAAVIYLLKTFSEQGHVCYPLDGMLQEAARLLEVGEEPVGRGIRQGLDMQRLVLDECTWESENSGEIWRGQVLYLKNLYHAEVGAADELARLLRSRPPESETAAREALVDRDLIKNLGDEQIVALQTVLKGGVAVITGGPGTGKTTMIRTLVKLLKKNGERVFLAAPTGRAAKRLNAATGEEAKTLHRLLEYKPGGRGFLRDHETPLECDWLIVDETSMVDIFLIFHLLKALADGTSLVLVGDVDQLPSVGSGNVLKDLILSKRLPVARLTKIYRQSSDSFITINAHAVNRGEFPKLNPYSFDEKNSQESGDFYFIKAETPQQTVTQIQKLCGDHLAKRFNVSPRDDLQILTPMHKGEIGSVNLNQVLQQLLNPKKSGSDEVRRQEQVFRVNDRVMQLRNNYDKEVFNGDIGFIVSIDLEEGEVKVRFDFVDATYTMGELDELDLAYAVTVHKSQGSEYPVVVMPVSTQHYMMLQKNLLYTGITRGKMLVILIGTTKAVALAIRNDRIAQRYTFFAERIRAKTLCA